MSELANSVRLGPEAGQPPAVAPAEGDESTAADVVDYVTPPPKRLIVVAVRYGDVRKGAPLPYDLAGADDEP
jgi:hypothetical protein